MNRKWGWGEDGLLLLILRRGRTYRVRKLLKTNEKNTMRDKCQASIDHLLVAM